MKWVRSVERIQRLPETLDVFDGIPCWDCGYRFDIGRSTICPRCGYGDPNRPPGARRCLPRTYVGRAA